MQARLFPTVRELGGQWSTLSKVLKLNGLSDMLDTFSKDLLLLVKLMLQHRQQIPLDDTIIQRRASYLLSSCTY